MGTLPPTPVLALVLPDPGTAQPFSTAVQNGWFQTIDTAFGNDRGRLGALEPFVLSTGTQRGVIPTGSVSLRDAYWGAAPVDAAGRVALANKVARWFNTDPNFGFEQRYFAPTTDSAQPGYLAQNARGTGGWQPANPHERGRVFKSSAAVVVPTVVTDIPDFTLTVPCSGGLMRLRTLAHWVNPTSNADRRVTISAQLDGVDIAPSPVATLIPAITGVGTSTPAEYVWEFTPTAGSRTIKLRYLAAEAASVSWGAGSFMTLEEVG